jgi:two-component system phosphate regulon sensor histidine kinase PhoR
MKFRTRLMLSYLLFILLITASFYLYFRSSLQSAMVEESKVSLTSQATLAKLLVEQDNHRNSPQQLAEHIGATIKARMTLIAANGTVTGDSDVKQSRLSELQNHLDRPEIQAALKTGLGSAVRYSETIRRDMLYTALRTNDGFVRLALPLDYVAQATETLHGVLGVVALLTILAALLLSYLLANMTSRPLREISTAAVRIGRGEQGVAITVTTQDEIGDLAQVLNDMAGRIESQMKNLSAEKQRLETILRGMGEGVMVASGDGRISLSNPAFRSLFGITGDPEGRHLIEISRHPDLLEAFTQMQSSGTELVREIFIPTGDITLLTHWVPLIVNGDDLGVVAVFQDISDMKRVENMRRDFVANVSHELRTPVSVIKGYAETLLDGVIDSDPERSKRFVEVIRQHSDRLASLITDILTLSRLESKEASLDLNPMDINGTINKACMFVEEGADQKKIIINNEAVDGLPRVMADQGQLEQVLINLLENAIKYTPEGGTVSIYTEADDSFVKVLVADTGIGIPRKDLSRIFERFYRVDEARSREQGGTGLGLAIVKHIIHLHGGEVSVTSEHGKGSVFSFTLKTASKV